MSIFGGITGSSSRQAADTLSSAANNAYGTMTQATNNAVNATNTALATNSANVNNAAAGATQTVNQAAGNANGTLAGGLNLSAEAAYPYMTAGNEGAGLLANYAAGPNSTFNPASVNNFLNTPAMQFQIAQGSNAINNTAAASGVANSGATLEALNNYGQNVASTYYQNAFNDALNSFQTNQNATLANTSALMNAGLTASGQFNQANQFFNGAQANNTMNAGYYGGNAAMNAATFNAGQNLSGQEFAGTADMQGTNTGLGYYMSGANSQAAGDVAEGNVFSNDLSLGMSLAGAAMGMANGGSLFNGFGGGGGGGVGTGLPPGMAYGVNGQPVYPNYDA